MKPLVLLFAALAIVIGHAQDTIVVTPKSGNQQAVEELNRSLRDLGESFRERREIKLRQEQAARDYQLRKQQVETERRLAEEQIAASKAAREKAASEPSIDAIAAMAAQAATDAARTVTESVPVSPPAGRFQLITTTVKRSGRDQSVILKLDTTTGQTWELAQGNGGSVWSEVATAGPYDDIPNGKDSTKRKSYTAKDYEDAATAFEENGKKELAELARQRAKELRSADATSKTEAAQESKAPVTRE